MNLKVSEELSVNVLPNSDFEFLMTSKEVAHGYGVTDYNIRQHKLQHSDEFIEGKHYVIAVSITNGKSKIPHNAVLWTKRGIVRLGFFIKSERAKLFRDWAEDVIINVLENGDNFLQPVPVLPAPKKRNHNRLTQERMIGILADVAKIEDSALRLSLISKLGL
ncbi:hypothetical protein EIB75_10720 [Epilithonimonas vandammei]|uniref:Bro-N domain-containing protein n=1 Tax=Epilithonimonas vandammei TaxID=2487072 RepID=A0A3G8ZFT7_9FLAO|nr:hypothetical protein [Epilithonimonas vandammei]AZI55695.1 hypothetical protein EIB75_10720 [Epilithonimonas vandammei]